MSRSETLTLSLIIHPRKKIDGKPHQTTVFFMSAAILDRTVAVKIATKSENRGHFAGKRGLRELGLPRFTVIAIG